MIESRTVELSVRRQCVLLGLNRTTLTYAPAQEGALNLELMWLIEAQCLKTLFYGKLGLLGWNSHLACPISGPIHRGHSTHDISMVYDLARVTSYSTKPASPIRAFAANQRMHASWLGGALLKFLTHFGVNGRRRYSRRTR